MLTGTDYLKLGFLLCFVCVVSGFVLSVTYSVTKERIEHQKTVEIQKSLPVVLPDAESYSDMKHKENIDYFEGYNAQGTVIGYALYGSVQGYQSLIKFIVGITPTGTITGLRILEHGETPGLGARIMEIASHETLFSFLKGLFSTKDKNKKPVQPWFPAMFDGKFYKTLHITKTDSDPTAVSAITGATITSEAVLKGVKNTVDTFLTSILMHGGA